MMTMMMMMMTRMVLMNLMMKIKKSKLKIATKLGISRAMKTTMNSKGVRIKKKKSLRCHCHRKVSPKRSRPNCGFESCWWKS